MKLKVFRKSLALRTSQQELNEAYIQKLMEIPEENFNKYHERD